MGHDSRHRTMVPWWLHAERGAALLLVVWVAVFFGIVLSTFAFSMRTEMDAARNFREQAEAAMLAKAGIARGLADLINAKTQQDVTSPLVLPYRVGPVRLGRGTYDVLVTNEDSRISLTRAPASVLQRLLRNTGVSKQQSDTIVASILDWRDQDDVSRQSGAESSYYGSLPIPYHPKNGPFDFVEEVLLVKGMTREIFYGTVQDADRLASLRERIPEERDFLSGEYLGVRPFVTVHGSGQVDRATAGLDVLIASGVDPAQAQELIRSRGSASIESQPARRRRTSTPRAYRIESIGRLSTSPLASRIVASVVREGSAQRPRFRVVAWQETES